MIENKEILGKRIRKYRKAAGMTMKELGLKLDLSEQAISQYERGKREPNILILKEIAKELKINITDLLDIQLDNYSKEFTEALIKERTGVMANLNVSEIENLEYLLNTRNPLMLNFEILTIFKAYRELIPEDITIEDFFSMSLLISENILSAIKIFISKYNKSSRLDKLDKYFSEYNDFLYWLREDYKDIDMSQEKYFDHSTKRDVHLIHNYFDVINDTQKKLIKNLNSEPKNIDND